MPTYRVTDKVSGVTLDLTGDSPPTEEELYDIFSRQQSQPATQSVQPETSDVGPIQNAVGKFGRAVGSSIASIPESIGILGTKLGDFSESLGLSRMGQPEQVSEALTYKLGKLVNDSFDEMFAVNTTKKETFLGDTLPSAAGSMAGFLLGGVAGKALKVPAALTVAATGAAAGGVEGFKDAEKSGASDEQQWLSFLANAGLGATEAVPIAGWLNRANKASGGKLKSAIVSGAEETAQEIFQQVGGNLTASKLAGYDPQRPWSQGAVEGGGAGLTLGTLGGLLFGKRANRGAVNKLTPEATDSGITEPVRPDETFDIRDLYERPVTPPVVEAKPEKINETNNANRETAPLDEGSRRQSDLGDVRGAVEPSNVGPKQSDVSQVPKQEKSAVGPEKTEQSKQGTEGGEGTVARRKKVSEMTLDEAIAFAKKTGELRLARNRALNKAFQDRSDPNYKKAEADFVEHRERVIQEFGIKDQNYNKGMGLDAQQIAERMTPEYAASLWKRLQKPTPEVKAEKPAPSKDAWKPEAGSRVKWQAELEKNQEALKSGKWADGKPLGESGRKYVISEIAEYERMLREHPEEAPGKVPTGYTVFARPDPTKPNRNSYIIAGPEDYGIKLSAKNGGWKKVAKDLTLDEAVAEQNKRNEAFLSLEAWASNRGLPGGFKKGEIGPSLRKQYQAEKAEFEALKKRQGEPPAAAEPVVSEAVKPIRLFSSSTPEQGKPFYLTDKKGEADAFSLGRKTNEYDVELKKPFDVDTSKDADLLAKFDKLGGLEEAPLNAEFVAELKSKGYDGITGKQSGYGGENQWAVVFDGAKAKSVSKPTPEVKAEKPATEPEPIGMGGATPAEFAPPQKFTTGNKNATVDAELKKMGLPPLMEVERKSNQSAWDEAMQKIDENPKEQDDLIAELKEKPRAATPVENAMLMHRRIDLKNEYNKATARWREAFESGDLVRAAEEAQRANGWRNQIADLSDITKAVGTEAGRDLQARRMMANEEFNLAAMETDMMMRKGRELTSQERIELMQAHDKIKELQNKLDELESGKEAKEVSTEIDKQIKDISSKTNKDTAVDREETILAGIKKKVDGGNQAQITPLVQKLARVFWMRGVRGREPMIDALHDALKTIVPDLTREETQRAFSGYGNYKPLSKAEIDVGLRDLRGQTQQVLKMKAIEERKPLEKTGVERRELSDEERRLVKQVNELKRKYGVVVTDPAKQLKSALQSRKTYYEHRISDLKYEIEAKQRIVKTKTPTPRDAELERLIAEHKALKAEHEAIFGSREMTDAQRLKLAIAAAERNQAYWEATLEGAKKGIFSKKVAGRKVTSAELEVIKARTETLKAQVEELKSLDAELQSAEQIKRLEESIAEYERKIAAGEFASAKKEGVTNPAIEALTAKRDALRKTLQDLREKSAPYIASKIAKAEKALDESIAETVRQINEGDIEARKPNPKISTPEIDAKRAELEELQRIRRELRNAAKPRKTPQEIALQALKSRMLNQQEKLLQRILDRDFEVKKREPVPMDAEARAIKAELDIVKREYQDELDRATWEKMSIFQKSKRSAADTYDAARALMTTGELSFILRQAKFTTLSHPILTAKALPDMFRALLSSEKKAHEVDLKTHTHPDADAARAAKLHLVEEGVSLHRQEEMMMGRWTGKIPVVKNFNRAAQVFLNKIRFDTWRAMRKSLSKTGTPTALEDAQIAMFVNEATGRGGLGKMEAAAVPLARVMFSPRYFASRLELAAGHSLWGGTLRTRKIIATEYARSLIGLGLYYTLLNAYFSSGEDDDKDAGRIETDPRSGDFGKVIVGKTRVDPLAGLAQVITFAARTATGEKKSRTGKVTPIRGEKVPYGGDKWSDVALDFGRGKLHPVPAAIANLFDGTDMGGNQATIMNQAENMISPITYVDVYRALKEQDLDDATAMSLLALLGEGLQTYQKPKKDTP